MWYHGLSERKLQIFVILTLTQMLFQTQNVVVVTTQDNLLYTLLHPSYTKKKMICDVIGYADKQRKKKKGENEMKKKVECECSITQN